MSKIEQKQPPRQKENNPEPELGYGSGGEYQFPSQTDSQPEMAKEYVTSKGGKTLQSSESNLQEGEGISNEVGRQPQKEDKKIEEGTSNLKALEKDVHELKAQTKILSDTLQALIQEHRMSHE